MLVYVMPVFALACSITLATVYGRYHLYVDAIAEIAISVLALAVAWERL